jgi:hypothetical protein
MPADICHRCANPGTVNDPSTTGGTMGRVRELFRKRFVRVSAGASALTLAIIASDSAVALAIPCSSACMSDRRLKRDVRAI